MNELTELPVPLGAMFGSALGAVLLTLGIAILIGGVSYLITDNSDSAPLLWIGSIITGFALLFPACSIDNHLTNIIKIQTSGDLITLYQDRVDETNAELKAIDPNLTGLLNADSPIKAMINAKMELSALVTEAKVQELDAQRDIMQRSISGFWWVNKMFPSK